jgi:hypothetical protein
MAVTPFIPIPRPVRPRVNSHAILAFERAGSRRRPADWVTADRPLRVVRPTPPGIVPIEIRVGRLIAEAVEAGRESLAIIEQRARQAARDFRWHRDREGRQALASVVDGVQSLLQLAMAVADAAGADLETLCGADNVLVETRRAAHALVSDQAVTNWTALAGTIEQLLMPALSRWRGVFDLLAPGPSGPHPFNPGPSPFAA